MTKPETPTTKNDAYTAGFEDGHLDGLMCAAALGPGPRWIEQRPDLHDLVLGRIHIAQIAKGVASENWFYHLNFTEADEKRSYSCPTLPEAKTVCEDHARKVLEDCN